MQQNKNQKTYLGDGLYCQHDGFQFILSAPRLDGEHFVALDPYTLEAFFNQVERIGNCKIEVKQNESQNDDL